MKNLIYVLLIAGVVGAPKVSHAMNSPFAGLGSLEEKGTPPSPAGKNKPSERVEVDYPQGKKFPVECPSMRITTCGKGKEIKGLQPESLSYIQQAILYFQHNEGEDAKKTLIFDTTDFEACMNVFYQIAPNWPGKITTLKFVNQKLDEKKSASLLNIEGIKTLEFNNSSLHKGAKVPANHPLEKLYMSGPGTGDFLKTHLSFFMNLSLLKLEGEGILSTLIDSSFPVLPYLKRFAAKDPEIKSVMYIVRSIVKKDIIEKFPSLQKLEFRGEPEKAFLFLWTSEEGALKETESTAVFEGFKTFSRVHGERHYQTKNEETFRKWIKGSKVKAVTFFACEFNDKIFEGKTKQELSQCCSFTPLQEPLNDAELLGFLHATAGKDDEELRKNLTLFFSKEEKVKKLAQLGEEEFDEENVNMRNLFCPKTVKGRMDDMERRVGEMINSSPNRNAS